MMDAPYDRDSIAMGPINKHGIEKSRYTSTPSWWIDRTCLPKKERRPRIYLYLRTGPWKRGEIFPFHPHRSSVYAMKMDRGENRNRLLDSMLAPFMLLFQPVGSPPFFRRPPLRDRPPPGGCVGSLKGRPFLFGAGPIGREDPPC